MTGSNDEGDEQRRVRREEIAFCGISTLTSVSLFSKSQLSEISLSPPSSDLIASRLPFGPQKRKLNLLRKTRSADFVSIIIRAITVV
jgi:hypothetical protein